MQPCCWTSREVHFERFPRTTETLFDAMHEALPELLWAGWRHEVFRTLGIASVGLRFEITGWPWWVPSWYARRTIANLALTVGIGGDATFVTKRAVLV